jgi:hypothetical protein
MSSRFRNAANNPSHWFAHPLDFLREHVSITNDVHLRACSQCQIWKVTLIAGPLNGL